MHKCFFYKLHLNINYPSKTSSSNNPTIKHSAFAWREIYVLSKCMGILQYCPSAITLGLWSNIQKRISIESNHQRLSKTTDENHDQSNLVFQNRGPFFICPNGRNQSSILGFISFFFQKSKKSALFFDFYRYTAKKPILFKKQHRNYKKSVFDS